jgi:hypothetical protein
MLRIGYAQVRLILYIAALITPFTALRFGTIGFGEVFFALALALLLALNGGNLRRSPALKPVIGFWFMYLLIISIGFFYNTIILSHSTGTLEGALFDFTSYCVVSCVVLLLADERVYTGSSARDFFRNIFMIWAIAFVALYLLSFRFSQVFGYPLRYHNYFSPLVENVHQAAMITCVMPFVMGHLAWNDRSLARKAFFIVAGILFALMAMDSGATKAAMAVAAGTFVTISFFLWQGISGRAAKAFFLCVLLAGMALFLAMYFDRIVSMAIDFFRESDGSAARENLYGSGVKAGARSLLIGFGPGQHVSLSNEGNFFSDAHNTLLTIFLQGGALSIILLVVSVYRLVRRISPSFFLLGAFAAFSMYFLGGDILRRLPIWVLIVGIIYFSTQARDVPPSTRGRRR